MLQAVSTATESTGSCGQRANETLGPWEGYKKPDRKHVQSYPVFLPGMYMLFLALFLKKNSLELDEVQRNAIKMIKRNKGWWWERTQAILGKIKKVEILHSATMEAETSCVYERRLHTRSVLNLSITRGRRREPYQLRSLEQDVSFLGVPSFLFCNPHAKVSLATHLSCKMLAGKKGTL